MAQRRITSLGKQQTEYFDHEVELSKGTRSIDISLTTDSRGTTPTGSFTAKVKSGLISLEQEDREAFLDAWVEAGEDAYDALAEKLQAIGGAQAGEQDGQLRLDGTDGEGVSGSELVNGVMKAAKATASRVTITA